MVKKLSKKNETEKTAIDKNIFMSVVHEKGFSVNKLGKAPEIAYSASSITRALNKGMIRTDVLKQIAKYIRTTPKKLGKLS